ncbi:Protein CBG27175 [Caenorhabditis briggsae]|uniref:Protein CBG27175 n=1 Tax=Caenorhabditis briggsae TaxID=6238 RepID=B6IL85_CAEBR|nr:Protein CBG27175 [Caenorhabditis briggsae]CAS00638.1 Protein CBG27175 [Caenorhabditis briggsae]
MRLDIQCLRGIAILLVFLFHLFPDTIVNGFLGVDIFFVISGFLMAKIITKTRITKANDFLLFYYKRFRRILPLYFLVIFGTVIMVHFYLGEYLWKNNNRYSLASLFLVTNQLVIHDQADYFNFFTMTSSINAFLHLWSLSVEMQFYLLVPFIFLGLQMLEHNYLKVIFIIFLLLTVSIFQLIAVSLITIIGCIAYLLVLEQFAFNFMLLRLWQFSAGFVALFCANPEKLPNKAELSKDVIFKFPFTKDDICTVSLATLGSCLIPQKLNVMILRPVVTLSTAIIISSENKNFQILSSKLLGYIGDVSYVLYLVHWPLIAIFPPFTIQNYLFLIVSIFLISTVLHHIYEQKYLTLDWKSITLLLSVLILGNGLLQINIRREGFWKNDFPTDIQEIIDTNKAQLPYSWSHEPKRFECTEEKIGDQIEDNRVFGYGSCIRGNGNFSIMMIGNSYVMNLRNSIRTQFSSNYTDFRYVSLAAGYGLYADTPISHLSLEISRKNVERYKPDILFILARHSSSIKQPIQEDDEFVQQMTENIKYYEKFVKKIVILDPLILFPLGFVDIFLQNVVHRPEALERVHLNQRIADKEMKFAKKRFSMLKCTKCEFFELNHVFLEGDKYLTFDRDTLISYVDNTIHLSSAGLKMCDNVFKTVAQQVMDTI